MSSYSSLSTRVLSAVDTSDFVLIDPTSVPFGVSVSVYLSPGASLTYTVEHTAAPISSPDDTAIVLPNLVLEDMTVSSDGNYFVPITGVRLNVTAYTSGTATMYVRQVGGRA